MKCFSSLVALAAAAAATTTTPASKTENEYEALGIGMEGYRYPCPTKFYAFEHQNEDVKMAYMDCMPEEQDWNGETVVMMHGKNFYAGYWERTSAPLVDMGYRVIATDQLGFGKSTHPTTAYSFHDGAGYTRQLLEAEGVDTAHVVAHSMGGYYGTRFALMFPNSTTSLTLENVIGLEDYRYIFVCLCLQFNDLCLSPVVLFYQPRDTPPSQTHYLVHRCCPPNDPRSLTFCSDMVPAQTLDENYRAEMAKTLPGIRAFHGNYYGNGDPAYWREEFQEYVDVNFRWTLSGEYSRWALSSAQSYRAIYEQPYSYEFGKLQVPTLLVVGQMDRTCPGGGGITDPDVRARCGDFPALGKSVSAQIVDCELAELDNIGHIPHVEAPDAFHEVLFPFIKRTGDRRQEMNNKQ